MDTLQRFQRAWLAHAYLSELVLIYPVYAIMMGEHGISPLELSTLFMAWSTTVIVLEVPSGTLADRFSRKRILVLSLLLKGCCFPIWMCFPSYWGYLAGFLTWGVAGSLGSGTREALLHDALRALRAREMFVKIYGRTSAAASIGVASALVSGGMLAEFGYDLALVASAAAPWLAAVVIAVWVREPAQTTGPVEKVEDSRYWRLLRSGLREVRGDPLLLRIIAMFAAVIVVYGVVEEYVGPLLDSTGAFSVTAIGAIYAACYVARTVGAVLAHRLPLHTLAQNGAWLSAASAVLLLGLWSTPAWLAVCLVGYFAATAAAEIILQGRMQSAIEGEARATITSVAGMAQEVNSVLLYLLIGWPAELYGWSWGIALVGGLSLAAALWFTLRPETKA